MGLHDHVGYSRMMMAEAAADQKLGTLLRMHETAFRQWAPCRLRSFTTG
jgi:transposase